MAATELQPCPFCGGTDTVVVQAGGGVVYVACNSCEAEGPWGHQGDDAYAVEAWNVRVSRGRSASPARVMKLLALLMYGKAVTDLGKSERAYLRSHVDELYRDQVLDQTTLTFASVKVGDRVVVERRVEPEGWAAGWVEDMDAMVGLTLVVKSVGGPSSGLFLAESDHPGADAYWFPIEALRRESRED